MEKDIHLSVEEYPKSFFVAKSHLRTQTSH